MALPNILFIQADQFKPQVLNAYGGQADTPQLDRLAETGVVFENTYCNFPLCAPSRFSMLSGMLPSRIGAYDNGAEYPAQIPTMAHYLRMAGYQCTLSGKQHFVGPDMLHGFHERLVPELYPVNFSWTPDWGEVRMDSNNDSSGVRLAGVCRRSVQMEHDQAVLFAAKARLRQFANDPEQPFFLLASFTHPHEPYYCRPEHWRRYRHADIALPEIGLQPQSERGAHTQRMLEHHALARGDITEENVRVARHAYLGNVSFVDDMIGELVAALGDCGFAHNTVIVFTSDHGDMLGEHGMWFKKHFLDQCARVPLILNYPERFSPGRIPDNVSLVDLLPTLADLAGIDTGRLAPDPLDGTSLVPVCEKPASLGSRPVFGEITSEGVPAPMFMVRQANFKLTTGGEVPDQLFELGSDPHELRDLSADRSFAEVLANLRALVAGNWDAEQLVADIRRSQKRRRLVDRSHHHGERPDWEHRPADASVPWLLRGDGLYNDWAWQGIEDLQRPD